MGQVLFCSSFSPPQVHIFNSIHNCFNLYFLFDKSWGNRSIFMFHLLMLPSQTNTCCPCEDPKVNWGWPLPPYCNIQNKHQTTTFPLYKWRQPFRRLGILLQSITGTFGIYIQLHIYTADHGTWGKLKSVWAHKELLTLLEIVKWS
jgi:hypothetical protein